MGIQFLLGFLVATQLVEQCDFLQHQVVATLNELRILLQEVESLLIGSLHAFVELVEFHENALIVLIEVEGAFHVFHCLCLLQFLSLHKVRGFVEARQRQVAPDSGEVGLLLCRQLPVFDGKVILTGSVIETSEIIGCLAAFSVRLLGGIECHHILGSVGEAVGTVCLFCLPQGIGFATEGKAIVPCHGRSGSLALGNVPDGNSLSGQSCCHIIECQFVVVLGTAAQHLLHLLKLLLVLRQQVFLVATTIVEEVKFERLGNQCQGFFLAGQFAQDNGLQRASLVVVPVVVQTAVHLIQGIFISALQGTDFGCLKVAGICPTFVPSRFPEALVCLIGLSLILQGKGKVVDGFSVIGIGIALGDEFHGLAQEGFCLVEAPLADVPQSEGVETTDVVGVAAQGFLVVVGGRPGGVAILLQMQSGQIELLVGLHLFGQQGCFGTVGDGTYLVCLGVPTKHGALSIHEGLLHLKGQFAHLGLLHIHLLRQHFLGRERHLLLIVHLAVVVSQHDAHLLL